MTKTEQVAGAIPSPFDSFIMAINANPYFIGMMMLMLNLGGRFISLELTKSQEAFLQNIWVRRLLILVVLFMGTRNIMVAFWMWIAVVFLLGYVLNENSSLCIFGTGLPGSKCAAAGENKEAFTSKLTPEEAEILAKLQAKANGTATASPLPNSSSPMSNDKDSHTDKETDYVDNYLQNMQTLRSGNENPRF